MPLIDTQCTACGSIHEQNRPLAMHPDTPKCLDCGADTVQIHLPKSTSWTVDPIVVYQSPDGGMRFPGDANGLSAANYARQGFKRIEVRGALEMRRFEQAMDKVEYSRAQRRIEHHQQRREENNARRASNIRHGLEQGFQIPERDTAGRPTGRMQTVRLSERGRDIMRAAQAAGERRERPSFSGANFHSEVFSFDRSNRDESRDSQGRRRRD